MRKLSVVVCLLFIFSLIGEEERLNPLSDELAPFTERDIYSEGIKKRKIFLPDVIASTLENQWKIHLAADDIMGQQGVYQSSKGPFDPLLDAKVKREWMDNRRRCTTQTLDNGSDNTLALSLSKLSRVGTEFSLQSEFRFKDDPSESWEYCDEYKLHFLIDQPLLRRFWYNREMAQEMISAVELKAVKWEFLQTISSQVSEALKRYFELVFTIKSLEINEETRERFIKLANSTSQLIEGGEMAATQIDQQFAEIFDESRKMTETAQSVYRAYNDLLFAMGETQMRFGCEVPDIAYEEFPEAMSDRLCWDPGHLEQLAMENRGDLIAARYRVTEARIDVARARQDRLPLLNVGVGAGLKNIKNSKTYFSSTRRGHPQEDILAQVTFSYPLGNDRATGELRSSLAANSQALIIEEELNERIRTDLNNALRNHYALVEQLHYAAQTVEWFEKSTQAEIERLKEGYSTVFVVLDFENRLANARINRLRILRDYSKNLVDLFFITGTLVYPDNSLCMAQIANIRDVDRLLNTRGNHEK